MDTTVWTLAMLSSLLAGWTLAMLSSLSCDHSCDDGSTWHGGRCACARTAVRPSFLGVRTSRLCSMDFKPRMHHPRTELKSVAASSAPVPVCATL